MAEDLHSWVAKLATELGGDAVPIDPDVVDVDEVLSLAADAAHALVRPAAPLTTYLAGLAAGLNGGTRDAVVEALEAAKAACAREAEN